MSVDFKVLSAAERIVDEIITDLKKCGALKRAWELSTSIEKREEVRNGWTLRIYNSIKQARE